VRERNVKKIVALSLLGVALFPAATPAQAATSTTTGAIAYDWDSGYRMTLCDQLADSRRVRAYWIRNGNHPGALIESRGSGNCSNSSTLATKVDHHQACRSGVGGIGWGCSNFVYTGY